MTASPKSLYFPVLTGLRALAAYLVFFSHNPLPPKRAGTFLYAFTFELYIGVSIFFVLSGFLITIRYQEGFKTLNRTFISYLRNRFARIYPMYFLLTTLTFIYYHSSEHNILFTYLMNITLLKGFFEKLIPTGIAQGWTLTVEECFYFLAPLIFILNRKMKSVWLILIFYFAGILLVTFFKNVNFWGLFTSYRFMFVRTFFGRCFEFFAGIALANMYKSGKKYSFFGKYNTIAGCLGIFGCVLLLMSPAIKNQYQYGLYSNTGVLINNILLPVCIAVFIWGLIQEQTLLRRLLESNVCLLLGKSSYTFYLIQFGFIEEIIRLSITHNYLYNFPVLIVIAIILFKTVEEPLMLFFRKPFLGLLFHLTRKK